MLQSQRVVGNLKVFNFFAKTFDCRNMQTKPRFFPDRRFDCGWRTFVIFRIPHLFNDMRIQNCKCGTRIQDKVGVIRAIPTLEGSTYNNQFLSKRYAKSAIKEGGPILVQVRQYTALQHAHGLSWPSQLAP